MSGIITKKDDEKSDLFKNSGQCRGKEVTLHLLLLMIMEKNSKIYVAGHRGMVGSAIVRELQR